MHGVRMEECQVIKIGILIASLCAGKYELGVCGLHIPCCGCVVGIA
jgi:hypothetical protein